MALPLHLQPPHQGGGHLGPGDRSVGFEVASDGLQEPRFFGRVHMGIVELSPTAGQAVPVTGGLQYLAGESVDQGRPWFFEAVSQEDR